MSRLFYDMLSEPYKPYIRYSSKKGMVFENPNEESRSIEPGLRSRIDVFTAGRETAGRSFSGRVCHLSEFAFFPDAEPLINSIIPTIPDAPGSFLFMETTGNGCDGFAFREWNRYKKLFKESNGLSHMVPLFFAWHDNDEYMTLFGHEKQKVDFGRSIDSEELALKKRFNLSLEQLLWRRNKIFELGGNIDAFMQEYPSDDTEAFIVLGTPIFDRSRIKIALSLIDKAEFTGEISHEGFLSDNIYGRLIIWEQPQSGHEYVVSVDPSRGINDEAVICVIDKESLKQVAEWCGVIDAIALAPFVRAIGTYYKNTSVPALVAIEISGGCGESTQYNLMEDYWNLYKRVSFDKFKQTESTKLGWDTTPRTKPLLIDFSTYIFSNDHCKINSVALLQEMSKFIRTSNSGQAEYGACDNRVMAWMIGIYVAGNGRSNFMNYNKNLSQSTEKSKQRVDEIDLRGRSIHMMCDTMFLGWPEKKDYNEKDWLNW
jgi:hypothetical protein